MIVAIHQPNFLPWIGYFYKMLKADRFVFLDDVQFIRRGYTARVKIKTKDGETWLTVPVIKKGRYLQSINEVELEPDTKWKKKTLGTLHASYAKAPFFKSFFPELESIIMNDFQLLSELNIALIKWLATIFEINTPNIRSSELNGITGESTDRLVNICKALNADKYLSGFGGQKYQEQETFNQNNIELSIYNFTHPVYPQPWGDFLPGLSSIDFLFNCGPPFCKKVGPKTFD